jgi:hypothetical protein
MVRHRIYCFVSHTVAGDVHHVVKKVATIVEAVDPNTELDVIGADWSLDRMWLIMKCG